MGTFFKWIGILVVGFIGLVVALAVFMPSPENSKSTPKVAGTVIPPQLSVTAAEFAQAYADNTVAADQKFKEKRFTVTGVVDDINTDIMGRPYLVLRGGQAFLAPQFVFAKDQANYAAGLKKGARVILICVGLGDIAKTAMAGDCQPAE